MSRGPLGDVERGVLAYALARWLGPGPLVVAAVVTTEAALREAVPAGLEWPLELRLGALRGAGELWLPEVAELAPAPRRPLPAWFPLEASVVAGLATLEAAELARLEPGDAIVPEELWIDRDRRGAVRVRVPGAERVFHCRADGALRVERIEDDGAGARAARLPREKSDMNEETIAKMSETPVTLRIEIARLELTLGEVASLAVGEVVPTGRAPSAAVTLRAGDRTVALGELVDVEGELAVQITELAEA